MPFPCSACRHQKRPCRISESSADCAECVRHGTKGCDVGLSKVQVDSLKSTKDKLQKQLEEAQDAELAFEESSIEAERSRARAERSKMEVRMRQRQIRKQLALVDSRANEMLAKEEVIRQRLDAQEEADLAAVAVGLEGNMATVSRESVLIATSGAPSMPTVPTLDQEINSFYSSWIGGNDVVAPGS